MKRAPASSDYSLITQAKGEDGATKGLVVHRLVQDFARRAMSEERRAEALREALAWVNAAFVGEPQDARNWPVLDPLAPHALAVAGRADEAGIAEPTKAGCLAERERLLSKAKARYAEAEPLLRRALASRRKSLGATIPKWRSTSTISGSCSNTRTALTRPSRSIVALSRSPRRATGRTILT